MIDEGIVEALEPLLEEPVKLLSHRPVTGGAEEVPPGPRILESIVEHTDERRLASVLKVGRSVAELAERVAR